MKKNENKPKEAGFGPFKKNIFFIFNIYLIDEISVIRWLDYFFIFGHLQLMKNCQTAFKICQIGFKLMPNTKLSIENSQKTFNT